MSPKILHLLERRFNEPLELLFISVSHDFSELWHLCALVKIGHFQLQQVFRRHTILIVYSQ